MAENSSSESLSLTEEVRSLRAILNWGMLAALLLTGSVFLYLLRELSLVRRQTQDLRQYVYEYRNTSLPVMEDLRVKLEKFATTNPDFNGIYRRYFATNGSLIPSENSPAGLAPAEALPVPTPPKP